VLLEGLCLDDIGVVAPAGPQFVVKKVQTVLWLVHRIDLDSTSDVFSHADSGCNE
jgi:hypothetical protein